MTNMKKFYGIMLALIVLWSMGLMAGCSLNGSSGQEEEAPPPEIVIAGGEKGTSYSNYAAAVYSEMNEVLQDVKFRTESNGNLVEGLWKVDRKSADITLTQGDVLYYAANQMYYFNDKKLENLRAVTSCYWVGLQFITRKDFSGDSPAALAGKRILVGEEGSLSSISAQAILQAYGVNEENAELVFEDTENAAEALQTEEVDAVFCMGAAPITSFMKMARTDGVRVLPVEGDAAKALMDQYPFYLPYTIPAGSYEGLDEDVGTLGVKTVLVVNKDVDEELVYVMTRVLFENKEAVTEANAKGAELHPQKASEGVSVPFHGGAVRYLNEIGVPLTE